MSALILHVNGANHPADAARDESLLSVLRERLDLTGTKYGCGEGQCGACTVLLDGKPVALVPHAGVRGRRQDDHHHRGARARRPAPPASRQAFLDVDAMQCGYCTPGMIVAAVGAPLPRTPDPGDAEIARAMDGNVCRCCTYPRIVQAIRAAAEGRGRATRRNEDRAVSDERTRPDRASSSPSATSSTAPPLPLRRSTAAASSGSSAAACSCAVAAAARSAQESGRARPRRRPETTSRPGSTSAKTAASPSSPARSSSARTPARRSPRPSPRSCASPLSTIRLVMGDTDLTPFDMGTFGSRSTPYMAPQLRKAAASAREAAEELAAQQWSVDRARPRGRPTARSTTRRRSARSRFGELTKGQKLVRDARGARSRRRRRSRVDGRRPPGDEGERRATSSPAATVYTTDLGRARGLLHGQVLRPPAFGATLASVEQASSESLAGAMVVTRRRFRRHRRAGRRETAARARSRRSRRPAQPEGRGQPSTTAPIFEYLRKTARAAAAAAHVVGSVDARRARPPRIASRRPTPSPTSRTSPLEPRAAVAQWKDGQLTVWTGTQRPFGVKERAGRGLPIPAEDKVRVIVPDTGSGYGGKHTGECAIEAARLAKAAGKPVKVVWTREEEFRWAYFRPAGVIDVKSGARRDGTLVGVGVPQLQLRHRRRSARPTTPRTSTSSSIPPARRCARARTAGSPRPRTTSRASRTWTSSRAAREARPARVPPART